MTDQLFTSTCCIPWKYKAEGGSSVVLSFYKRCCESCCLPIELERILKGTILRLRKKKANDFTEDIRLNETELLLFFRDALGPEYVKFPLIQDTTNEKISGLIQSTDVQQALLQVPENFIHRVYNLIIDMNGKTRPEIRIKEKLEFSGIASIHYDHSLLNEVQSLEGYKDEIEQKYTLCVEIKPKSGVPPDFDSSSCCRYCAQKALKSYSPVSSYCPLDLYSKNSVRITRAITALVDSPQNNFRVFLNGMPIFTQELLCDGTSFLCGQDRLQECLSRITQTAPQESESGNSKCLPSRLHDINPITVNDLIAAISRALSIDPILDRLLSIQLEGMKQGGATRATEMLYALTSTNSLPSSSFSLPKDVKAILQAATANDCSLLITFKIQIITNEEEKSYSIIPDYSISVIDLDSKPLEKAPTWLANEKAAKEAYHQNGLRLGIQCHFK
jgi:hypothetical protein